MRRGYIRKTFTISADIPADAYMSELRAFIQSALECWGGQYHPDDPLFGSFDRVKVTPRCTPKT